MTLSTQKLTNFLPTIACVLLLVVIAVQLANLTLQLFFDANTAASPNTDVQASPVKVAQNTKNPVIQYARQISQKHIFGVAGTVEKKKTVIEAPETKLDLKLRGILATGDELGLAIIAKGRQAEKMYKIGDKLPGNASLNSVYADRVLIESSRGLETLRIELDKNRLSDIKASEGNLPPSRSASRSNNSSGNKLAEIRKEIIRNPLSFTKKISIKPEKDASGKLLGYKLKPSKDDKALFEELGLQSGDIATSLNGLDLSDSKNSRRAMNILRRSKKINMTVLRDGQEVTIEQQL